MTAPPSALQAHLGYWLRYVSNSVSHSFARRMESRGVTVAEWVLMRQLLEVESLAPSRLAERMGMTRGAVTRLADRLIAKSLLTRMADPGDGRAQKLALTARGRRLVPQLAALADVNDAEFFDELPAADRAALLRILKGLVDKHRLRSLPVD
ncbi:MAG TPA: MarR family transcriptional regulator [Steroidobacteraceae bacterium]|nr:MarR family transcriptional regulator [Steroidobacteraceae bacterium]